MEKGFSIPSFLFHIFYIISYLYISPDLSLHMFNLLRKRKRRQPSLKQLLSKAMHCSKRRIFIGDRHGDPVTDRAMREFIVQRSVNLTYLEGEIEDCEDYALAFHKDAKDWFRANKINARVGEIWCYPSKDKEAHAFCFSVKHDNTVSFWEGKSGRERFLNARVQLVKL